MPSTILPKRTHAQKNDTDVDRNNVQQNQPKQSKDGDQIETTGNKRDAVNCAQHWEDSVHSEDGQNEYKKFKDAEAKTARAVAEDDTGDDAGFSRLRKTTGTGSQGSDEEQTMTKKRGGGANARIGANKKQKKVSDGAKGEPQGIAGDKTRVPDKGQKVQWSATPGIVNGEVIEVVYEEKTVKGQLVKGSKEDPLVVLKSDALNKICVHKPEELYFN